MVKVEVEEDQNTKEEEESHTDVEEADLQAQVEGATTKIQAKAQAKIKHKDRGVINLKSNVVIAKIMGIMQMNVERSKMTWVIKLVETLQKKIRTMVI